jgi:hypothetical protein
MRVGASWLANEPGNRTYQIRFKCYNIGTGVAKNIKFTATANAPASVMSVDPSSVVTQIAIGGYQEVTVTFNLNNVPKNSTFTYKVNSTYEDGVGTIL